MRFLSEAWMYARFLRGLPGFLHDTITPERAWNALRHRLADREATLVHVAERGFFGAPRSPYRDLFRLAGCGFSVSIEGDWLAPSATVDEIHRRMPGLEVERVHLDEPGIDHFKWARKPESTIAAVQQWLSRR